MFKIIYQVKIDEITIRELLLFSSLYVCKSQSDMLRLVQMQPQRKIFFKSFLELDGTNMISILALDSGVIKELLDDKNKDCFNNEEFPIFYKNKLQKITDREKFFYRSAVDSAIRNNQIEGM